MNNVTIEKMTCARIPTNEGEFRLCLYRSNLDEKEHLALEYGKRQEHENVLVRIHSECFTGDVLGSLRCDCGQQLKRAMQLIAQEGAGIIIYLRQEGRGIGLLDKLRAYNLQDMGYDTVDANLMLGHKADARNYTMAALILQDLGVRSLRLLTNNPLKIESLQQLGLPVVSRVPLTAPVTPENAAYLATKVQRMRHMLDLEVASPAKKNGRVHTTPQRSPVPPTAADRPFVTLSYAQSLDGSITARRGHPLAISGSQSLAMTHRLRASHDAILVGIGTVLADNPRLNVRLVKGENPQPIIVDSHLRFPHDARMLQNRALPPWIATTQHASHAAQQKLETAGARVLRLPATGQGRVSLKALLALLPQMGIKRLMVEGGAEIITAFLNARLVDRLVITVAPLLVGGLRAVDNLGTLNGNGFPKLHNLTYQQLGDDMVLAGDLVWREA